MAAFFSHHARQLAFARKDSGTAPHAGANGTAPAILSQTIMGNRKHTAAAKNRPRLAWVTFTGKKSVPWIATARAA